MKIDLLGTSFTIQSDEDPAYLRNLVGYYRDKITEVRQSVTTSDDLKVAILGALTVVDELFRERHKDKNRNGAQDENSDESSGVSSSALGESESTADEIESIAHRLIERLDSTLEKDS